MSAPSIWVDDRHALVRRGLVTCLTQAGFSIKGESTRLAPDPVVAGLDVLLFEAEGAALRRAVRLVAGTPTRLVATVRSPTEREVREVVEAGVAAVLVHGDLTPESVVANLRAVVAGSTALPKDVLPRLLTYTARVSQLAPGRLSVRERAVLRLLADGMDTRGIAADLRYSERTVKNVVHDMLTKLDCRTRAQAVALATREGVI